MFTGSKPGLIFLFSVVLVVALDSFAREPIKSPPPVQQRGETKVVRALPIKSPPPVQQRGETKVVRARDAGVPFDGAPGKLNSITDVPGVEVGYTTLISGEGKLEVGEGPVRTGVTAIIPPGH